MSSGLEPRLPRHARGTITEFLRGHVETSGTKGIVVGLSGGIDSALVARLGCDALGPEHVLGISMPDAHAPPLLVEEVRLFAKELGIGFKEVPIQTVEEAFIGALDASTLSQVSLGNLKARTRMALLYAHAHASSLLVAGTGNKSEILLGYFTKYGDGGVDVLPIGDLYKTSVYELSRELGLPQSVILRPPSAGLWEGQTDEAELGFTYAFADQVLVGLERLLEAQEIADKLGAPIALVNAVVHRVIANRHKRRPPPIPKLAGRTVGADWRD